MLQKLNERIQGLIAWVVIILISGMFALFGIEYYMQSRSATTAKAEVNGQAINTRDFELNDRRLQQQHSPSELTAAAEANRKQALLNEMIKQTVATQAALASGLNVSVAQTINAIQSIPQFQQDGHFSVNRYQQGLNNASFTPDSFQREVQQELLLKQQQFAFADTAFALPYELKQYVTLSMQTRDYDYLVIPTQQFAQHITIDDKAINAYYQQHHEAFKTPEKVSIEYVRLSMHDIREKTNISDEQLRHYYDDNKSSYYTPAEWHVAHIFFAIPAGASIEQQKQIEQKALDASKTLKTSPSQFNQLVKTQSDDKLSVADAGVLPWIVAGQSEFDKTLVDLKTVGEISEPVKTSRGYEIFKLLASKPAELKPFDSVKKAIQEQLVLDKVQTEYSRMLEQLSDLAYQTPDSLEPIAAQLHLTIQKSEPFSREGGEAGVTKNSQVIQAAFSPQIINQGDNSEPLQVDNDTVIVLRLAQHIPAAEKTLSQVKSTIEALLVKQQADNDAKELGQTLLKLQHQDSEQKKLIDQHHLQWQNARKIPREDKTVPDGVNSLAFQSGRMGSLVGDSMSNGDFVLVRLTKINDGQLAQLDKKQQSHLLKQIAASHGSLDFELYMNELMSKAKIVRY